MSTDADLYFRVRDPGAAVFRTASDTRNRRLDLRQIAVLNMRTGDIKPSRGETLSEAELSAIRAWRDARQTLLERRQADDLLATIEALNRTAHWAQTRADPAELEALTEPLLLAMHDLRTVLVRKAAERQSGSE